MSLSFKNIPTVELHRHWEAGMSPEVVARLAQRNNVDVLVNGKGASLPVDPQNPDSLSAYFQGISRAFEDGEKPMGPFLDAFRALKGVLRTIVDIRDAIFWQLQEEQQAGSIHSELRGSPMSIVQATNLSPFEVVAAVQAGIEKAWDELAMSSTQILCFSREKGLEGGGDPFKNQAPIVADLAAQAYKEGYPIAIDIASGNGEVTHPPRMFRDALAPAIHAGVPITVHAGEQGLPPDFADAPPEMIRQAVEELGARRIGHGTALMADADLRQVLIERRIGVEMCPVSNAAMGYMPLDSHPMTRFLHEDLLVSAGTDDPIFFGISGVRDMIERCRVPLGISVADVIDMTQNAINTAFVSDERRRYLHVKFLEGLDRVNAI